MVGSPFHVAAGVPFLVAISIQSVGKSWTTERSRGPTVRVNGEAITLHSSGSRGPAEGPEGLGGLGAGTAERR